MNQLVQQKRDNSTLRVLLTGASGYLAGHVLDQLLKKGYKVRGTVRSLKDPKKVNHLYEISPAHKVNLELIEADLLNKECWDAATKDVDFVMHVASPLPREKVNHEDEVLKPAVQGTEWVFQAALRNKVKKIVITSSIASMFAGNTQNSFSEADWSDPLRSQPYEKSKHLAEKKAWEIFEKNRDKIQMTVFLPGYMQGPSFHSNDYLSADFILKVLKNDIPAIPKVSLQPVDVREAAYAHVACLDQEKLEITNGQRYTLVEGSYWMDDLAQILRDEFSRYGYKITSTTINSPCLFSLIGLFDPQIALIKPFFGRMLLFDNTKSRVDLGVQYRYHKTTMIEFAYDLIKKGQIPNKLPNQVAPENLKLLK